MKTALQHLSQLADAAKAAKYPTVPYPVKSKYSDKSANDLTRCIVDYLNLSGHFATRLSSTGTFRADIGKYIPSQQRVGLPDVFAVVEGHAVLIEIKIGADRLSDAQKRAITCLKRAGACVYVARDFQSFYDWFTALLPTLTEDDSLPFGPTPQNQNV